MAWGDAMYAVFFSDAGDGELCSGKSIPPGMAKISGQKILITNNHHRLWGRRWLGVLMWLLTLLVPLVAGQKVLAE